MMGKPEIFGDPGSTQTSEANQDLGLANHENSPIENKREYPGSANPKAARHHRAAKILRIALTLGAHRFTADGRMAAWVDFAKVLAVRLSEEERALLAYWALRTLQLEVRLAVFEGAHLGASR